jgi:hypothetical protein
VASSFLTDLEHNQQMGGAIESGGIEDMALNWVTMAVLSIEVLAVIVII